MARLRLEDHSCRERDDARDEGHMGRDGTEGATRLVACGGSVLVQDEATSAVWGMPRSVAEAGLACAVMTPKDIAARLAERIEEAACK